MVEQWNASTRYFAECFAKVEMKGKTTMTSKAALKESQTKNLCGSKIFTRDELLLRAFDLFIFGTFELPHVENFVNIVIEHLTDCSFEWQA